MPGDRFVVLGLAHVRSTWARQLSQWANAAAVPIDLVRCMSTEEVVARLGSGRPFSAVVVDAGLPRVDRDLVDTARRAGCAVVIVGDGRSGRDWSALGATAVLSDGFDAADLLSVLRDHAAPIGRVVDVGPTSVDPLVPTSVDGWRGRLVAVTGPAGCGATTAAMAAAQGLAADPRHRRLVLLADLALHADLAMLHHARDIVPGLQEFVEAHRHGTPTPDEVADLVHDVTDRGYHLLLGLRRHRDWAVLRARALDAALDSLRHAYRFVVADVDDDVEGEAATGSIEIEERNLLARTAMAAADVVVVVGDARCTGLHALARCIHELADFGVAHHRMLPVVNRAPRRPRGRAELSRALADLTAAGTDPNRHLPNPVFLPERRGLDVVIRDAAPLPDVLVRPLARAIAHALAPEPEPGGTAAMVVPLRVTPGTLGRWTSHREAV